MLTPIPKPKLTPRPLTRGDATGAASNGAKRKPLKRILDLALENEKPFWKPGELVIVWHGKQNPLLRVYLQEQAGEVVLRVSGQPEACLVFWYDPITDVWYLSDSLVQDYQRWKEGMQLRLYPKRLPV